MTDKEVQNILWSFNKRDETQDCRISICCDVP